MKRAVFIGRWTPFHKGHLAIMQPKIDAGVPLLVLIRDTPYDLYPPRLRKRMIEAAMHEMDVDAKVMVIDDIDSVNYGRGVGYEINEIDVSEDIKKVSATNIRSMIDDGDPSWKEFIPQGADRVLEDYMSGKGIVVWFTGLPKSGKTTIADLASYELDRAGIRNERLDSHGLRETLSKDLGFTKEDRETNMERASYVAELLSRNGTVVLSSFIAPYREQRAQVRKRIEEQGRFVEAFVQASLETAKSRDTEGLYERAEKGEIENFTGVSDPYEEPRHPEILLDTENRSAEDCAHQVVEHVLSLR